MWGGTLYVWDTGEQTPYHWHYGEEEVLVVLRGRIAVRTPEGERELGAWDTAWFPTGERGAHAVRALEPSRFLMVSTLSDPEVTVYPDTGKVAAFAGWSREDVPTTKGLVEPA